MPLYEFFCKDCHKKIEELCSSTVTSVPCPTCGKAAKKVFSTFQRGPGAQGGGTASSNCGG